jgi:hypothetical protein
MTTLRGMAPILSLAGVIAAGCATLASAQDTTLCDPSSTTCRTVSIVNNCEQTIWVATQGNSVFCKTSSDCPTSTSMCDTTTNTCSCSSASDCATTTQVCDTTASPARCDYAAPGGGGITLTSTSTDTVYLPDLGVGNENISWSGRIWGRTGCPDFQTCGTPGTLCDRDRDCCTNAGCVGAAACTSSSDCPARSCQTSSDCPAGGACNDGLCDTCISGHCSCEQDADCPNGGSCQDDQICKGKCGPNGLACETGDCAAQFQCQAGVGGKDPATFAEFALLPNSYDTYDVSQVDGFNVGIQIQPTQNVDTTAPAGFGNAQPWCGVPGCASGTICPGQQAACPFTDQFSSCLCGWGLDSSACPQQMQAVAPLKCSTNADCGTGTCDSTTTPPTCTCASDSQCPAGTTCGVNANVSGKQMCGTYVGCVSAKDACTFDSSLGPPLRCGRTRLMDMYACSGVFASSCYTAGADRKCCGCASWSPGGNQPPFPVPGANTCQESNPLWVRFAEKKPLAPSTSGFALSFKNACPTAYSFGYDDPTSTFNCEGTGPTTPVTYSVTFCPCGSPGAVSSNCGDGKPPHKKIDVKVDKPIPVRRKGH